MVRFHAQHALSRIAILAILAIWTGAFFMNVQIPRMVEQATLEFIDLTSRETLSQIKDIRDTYAETVAKGQPGQNPRSAMRGAEPTHIPLPIEFIRDITRRMSGRDIEVKIVSPFPWPGQSRSPMDSFLNKAWQQFRDHPDEVVAVQEGVGLDARYRMAIADRLSSRTCVQCHNEHRDSPIRTWRQGDVRGIITVTTKVGPAFVEARDRARLIQAWLWGTCLLTTMLLLIAMGAVRRRELAKEKAHHELIFLAHHDALTGALNRNAFHKKLGAAINMPDIRLKSILFVDLDHFKQINDEFGHEIGDAMICRVASTLTEEIGKDGLIARLGGDEFVVALNRGDPESLAGRILKALGRPKPCQGQVLGLSASIGIAKAEPRPDNAEAWIRRADLALYKAKTSGRGRYALYSLDLDEAQRKAKRIEAILAEAIESETLDVHFQPIWDIQRGRLVGFEALARLADPEGGMISPALFIPIAEDNHQINKVGEIVMRKACTLAASWPVPVRLAVNISPAQMTANRRLTDLVEQTLKASGLAPGRLELEITEGILLDQNEQVMADLRRLQEQGIRIVIDDFGAGYSGISYFWKFPFNKIKLDRSLVQGAEIMRGAKAATLHTIMELARQFSMDVTGEGVETLEDLRFLKELGCHQGQGYLLGRPMIQEDATKLVGSAEHTERSDGSGSRSVIAA
ncbi:EAL domain-containing protein [Rhabdaerophilum sp. SD176]|uniref:putative bifunctional diguanylate cyclase/phosphodiesterase n=1 Tax=Rhabdaerophilum sp. SD176 TaxID=2983548 RepID=UPI0024DF9DC2|nr:EAL domain-containing protein [Rhabdaerophilum sp. SD176]